jgi:hypothetical protein
MIGRGQGCSLRAVLLRLLVFFKLHTRLKSLLAARALGLGLLAGHDLLGLEDTGVESSFQRSSSLQHDSASAMPPAPAGKSRFHKRPRR